MLYFTFYVALSEVEGHFYFYLFTLSYSLFSLALAINQLVFCYISLVFMLKRVHQLFNGNDFVGPPYIAARKGIASPEIAAKGRG
jgi:hypothetical protein